ncbi:hypothetical protein PsorP6_003709 [Peronosclerospora sorghi]|uniref:Uncharacterized protein n=1 Tax=Peronosclerospora sorghi TaxID=230839 RepID=A0ACC0VJR9_9STRA|nr:hypothetical protein PsorP6_003709 [Peronosclerospora sorghi]
MVDDHFCNIWYGFLAEGHQLADSEEEHDVEWMKSDRVATLSRESDWLQQLPLSVLYGNLFNVPALQSNLATKIDTIIPVSALYCFITDEASGLKENRFAFIRQLLSYFTFDDLSIETDVGSSASEQLTTDLFAQSFILMASPNSKLLDLATRMHSNILPSKPVERIGGTLTCIVRTLCERFLEHADMFGTYLGFVIDEISEILFSCSG